ncbi:hypothetical protein QBC41DRAFT_346661 [Cercophora samala]|uniref:CMP/dCMP-type deaminase domain-containing protein n=1 Tax=Cercophora samala TaxID=330535 RepID=A0AA40DCX3_9PEZI|nr:hypothetical protein QBC41DRAFT_346661 [Cercophora samala]
MKRDQYLQLCLQQATKSPLWYRHGSIVVKGGKVLGQGFNDHRPGFDGGALKTGSLRKSASPYVDVIKSKERGDATPNKPTSANFTPFEIGGDQFNSASGSRVMAKNNTSNEKDKHKRSNFQSQNKSKKKKKGPEKPLDAGKLRKGEFSEGPNNTRLEHVDFKNSHELRPKNATCHANVKLHQRMIHPKLIGADVYVVRVTHHRTGTHHIKVQHDEVISPAKLPSQRDAQPVPSSPRSLHDELTTLLPIHIPVDSTPETTPVLRATSSRPCYRCINYMQSVGIKRVFWTNKEGDWEGAKVRDLVNVLNGCDVSGSPGGSEMFITKHELLMRMRLDGV